jgi:S-(hydroxymethyl)glutathione dehydrogenase/alcohol dehydrogenase
MRVRAAVLREPGRPVAVEEVELDPPKADEVLVRIAAVGVCHSDVRLADGDLGPGRGPAVLGHEGAGVVESIGDGITHVRPGDHVALCFVPACRTCRYCLAGKPNLCLVAAEAGARGTLLDGTSRLHLADGTMLQHGLRTACFADLAVVASGGVIPIPAELPLWQAALLGCGVVTGMGAVRNAARLQPGEAAAVIGCGGVGLQVVAAARIAGAEPLIAIDRVPEKLDLAVAHGATHGIATGTDPNPTAVAVHELTDGGVDFAFEVVGRRETIRLAWDLIRPGGTAIVVGLAPDGEEASVPAIEFLSEKSLRGSYYGSGDPAAELPGLAAMAVAGELDVAGVVTSVEPLEAVNDALDRLRQGEGARTVLIVDRTLAGYEAAT